MNKKKQKMLRESTDWRDAIFFDSKPTKEEIAEWKKTIKYFSKYKKRTIAKYHSRGA